TNTKDELLATGQALLSAFEMLEMDRGMAVKVRQGAKKK
ncbi:MAG: pseudouridine synthase, partial [Archaeoglobaceae archaeon]